MSKRYRRQQPTSKMTPHQHERRTGLTVDNKTIARLITSVVGASVIYLATFLIAYSKLSQRVDDLDQSVQELRGVVIRQLENKR
jgi:hypothetical protein